MVLVYRLHQLTNRNIPYRAIILVKSSHFSFFLLKRGGKGINPDGFISWAMALGLILANVEEMLVEARLPHQRGEQLPAALMK